MITPPFYWRKGTQQQDGGQGWWCKAEEAVPGWTQVKGSRELRREG